MKNIMIKTIIIIGAFALLHINTAHGATDRELFMCSVDTIECPEPATEELDREEVKPEVVATSTTAKEQEIIRLKAMIVLLNDLLIRLRALQ
jgi:hypothetical protein